MLVSYVSRLTKSPLINCADSLPWNLTQRAEALVTAAIPALGASYRIDHGVAVHYNARIEPTATIKAPAIIGPHCFIGAHTLLRGGIWLGERCSVGPGCEVKSSFLFAKTRLAHFNFVGDSIIGSDVNFEAGSIVANTRNERSGYVTVSVDGKILETGMSKFGALVGDGCRVGANAVLAPGTLLPAGTIVERLELIDHEQR